MKLEIRQLKNREEAAKIVGEVCKCGHTKEQHQGILHSGACEEPGCGCNYYTYKAFIIQTD